MAHCSLDENLIAAFSSRDDIHAFTARRLLHIATDEPLTVAQRRIGKTINFGVIYGEDIMGIEVPVADQHVCPVSASQPSMCAIYHSPYAYR